MPDHYLMLALAAFVVGMSKGGLASAGTLAVPFLAIWMDPLAAAALLLPIFLVSDVFAVGLYRRDFSRRIVFIMVPAGLMGILVATLLQPYLDEAAFTFATGAIGLGYLGRVWWKRRTAQTAVPAQLVPGLFWGFVAGLTTFISHSGAPPFQTYVLPQRLPKLVFAGTVAISFAVLNVAKLPAYGALGLFDNFDILVTTALCFAAIIGTFAGRHLAEVLPEQVYRNVIHVLLFAVSVQLIWRSTLVMAGA